MMKKLIYLFSAVALLCGCDQTDVIEQPNQGGTTSGDLPEVIYASADGDNDQNGEQKSDTAKTRNTVMYYKYVVWDKDDAIAYFGPKAQRAKYQYQGEEQVISAEFVRVETDDIVPEGAIMPSTAVRCIARVWMVLTLSW